MNKEPIITKIVIIGDRGVGKTSLLYCYCENKLATEVNNATIGVDFKIKLI